jgi:lysophospholipase L1-like esterase
MKRIGKKITIILIIITGLFFYRDIFAKELNESKSLDNIRRHENIVFFGDSITEFYPIEEIYGSLPVVQSGVAGYKTTDVMNKIDKMVTRYNPTSVYILIGTNDIIHNTDEEKAQAIGNIKKIVETIHKDRKKTKIYVESLLPINRSLDPTRYYVGDRENSTIQEVNSEIEKYCEEGICEYINMYDELTDSDGNLSKRYTNDGLHPNDLGYAIMTRKLLTYIYGANY